MTARATVAAGPAAAIPSTRRGARRLPGTLPLLLLPASALCAGPWVPPWALMSALALSIFFGLKWMTWCEARQSGVRASVRRSVAYVLLWPGMDARAFLEDDGLSPPAPPAPREWIAGTASLALGVVLIWEVAPRAVAVHPLLGGWTGFLGLGLLFHFGAFRLLALAWGVAGVRAAPIMNAPLRSQSLAELWGRRWNLAFHDLATRFVFDPLRAPAGAAVAGLTVFLVSGLVHELVISVPARGGYGLPTLYFLAQGAGILAQRTPIARRLGLARGVAGRITTFLVAAGPLVFLFHPPFIRRVVLPLLSVLGAMKGA